MITLGPIDFLEGSRILITGGTGSLGTKLTQLVLDGCSTTVVVIYSRDEFKQYLEENGVGSMIYYPVSLHQQNAFKQHGYRDDDFEPVGPAPSQAREEWPVSADHTQEDAPQPVIESWQGVEPVAVENNAES